jgi:hypothetical protein
MLDLSVYTYEDVSGLNIPVSDVQMVQSSDTHSCLVTKIYQLNTIQLHLLKVLIKWVRVIVHKNDGVSCVLIPHL